MARTAHRRRLGRSRGARWRSTRSRRCPCTQRSEPNRHPRRPYISPGACAPSVPDPRPWHFFWPDRLRPDRAHPFLHHLNLAQCRFLSPALHSLLALYAYGLASVGSSGACGAAEVFLFMDGMLLPQGVLEGQLGRWLPPRRPPQPRRCASQRCRLCCSAAAAYWCGCVSCAHPQPQRVRSSTPPLYAGTLAVGAVSGGRRKRCCCCRGC